MLVLYDYFRSSASFRVRITLNLKGLPYETAPIHLLREGGEQFSETYKKINPHCLVPALQNGTQILTQSLAIIEYLDEMYPSPPLLPSHPYEKALARAFALAIAADIHPLNNLRILNYLHDEFKITEAQKNQWYHQWINTGLFALEKQLATYPKSQSFCFGPDPSIADICLIPQLYNARRYNCSLEALPTLRRIEENCKALPAFVDAWPAEAVT